MRASALKFHIWNYFFQNALKILSHSHLQRLTFIVPIWKQPRSSISHRSYLLAHPQNPIPALKCVCVYERKISSLSCGGHIGHGFVCVSSFHIACLAQSNVTGYWVTKLVCSEFFIQQRYLPPISNLFLAVIKI